MDLGHGPRDPSEPATMTKKEQESRQTELEAAQPPWPRKKLERQPVQAPFFAESVVEFVDPDAAVAPVGAQAYEPDGVVGLLEGGVADDVGIAERHQPALSYRYFDCAGVVFGCEQRVELTGPRVSDAHQEADAFLVMVAALYPLRRF